jgi:glycosyltransferase involved in cell wall biosynthesis
MRISVAMATYNGERFLGEQLESIARQSRPPDELVISDDVSSDSTLALAAAFADQARFDVVIIDNADRLGYGENFLRAVARCTGELIAFSDQDDVWHVDKLSLCERPFLTNPRASLVAHSTPIVDELLRPLGHIEPHIRRRRTYRGGSLAPFRGFTGRATVARSALLQAAPTESRPLNHYAAMDQPMSHEQLTSLICSALGDVVVLPGHLSLWRRHTSNASADASSSTTLARARDSLHRDQEHDLFERQSRAAAERRSYLARLRPIADELGDHAVSGLERALEGHDRYAASMARRAEAYAHPRRQERGFRFASAALRGDYGRRTRGGLGVASLARDLAVGVVRHP